MVLGVVAGLKNGELVMAGVVGGDCRDKVADRRDHKSRMIYQRLCVDRPPHSDSFRMD